MAGATKTDAAPAARAGGASREAAEPATLRGAAQAPVGAPEAGSFADELVDDLLPDEFDWRRVVRRYPIPALAVAALGGYLLARSRGPELLAALGDAASDQVAERLGAFAERELL